LGKRTAARGRRGPPRWRRESLQLPGVLLHIDVSKHGWFSDERWNDLLVILGDVVDLSLSIHDF
jgi:hypothetical protein